MAAAHAASLNPGRKPIKDWSTRTPEEEARHQRMLEKCRKWSEPQNQNQAVPAPMEAPAALAPVASGSLPNRLADPQLVWKRTSPHQKTSGCQRYQVTKEVVGHHQREDGFVICQGVTKYQCWRRIQWLWYIRLGPYQPNFDAAKALCEEHLAGVTA